MSTFHLVTDCEIVKQKDGTYSIPYMASRHATMQEAGWTISTDMMGMDSEQVAVLDIVGYLVTTGTWTLKQVLGLFGLIMTSADGNLILIGMALIKV